MHLIPSNTGLGVLKALDLQASECVWFVDPATLPPGIVGRSEHRGTWRFTIVSSNSRLPFLAAFLFALLAIPLSAQVNDTYVVPAAANAAGAFGTRWLSQLSVFNPQLDYSLKVSVTYLPTGGGKPIEVIVTVPPNGVVFTDNVLEEVFGVHSGTGALLIATFPEDNPGVPNDVISRAILVTSNTFNNSSSGTYGQTIPGVWAGLQDYATDGISAIAHGVRHLSRFGWRTNFGAVNLARTPVTMRISIYDANGKVLVQNVAYTVPASGHAQWSLPVEVDHGSVEFFVDDASHKAVVFPYTSTIDQYSGDPTYQTPTLLAGTKTVYPTTAKVTALAGGSARGTGSWGDRRILTLEDARAVRDAATSLGEVIIGSKPR